MKRKKKNTVNTTFSGFPYLLKVIGQGQHSTNVSIVMNSELLEQAETSEVSFSSTAKGSRKEIFANRMKTIPGMSVSFSMNTVIVFPNISSEDYFWVTIIAYNHVSSFQHFKLYYLYAVLCSGNLLNMMEIKYKSCALFFYWAISSVPKSLVKIFTHKTNGTQEINELHISKDLLQICVIVAPFKLSKIQWHAKQQHWWSGTGPISQAFLRGKPCRIITCYIFKTSLMELHLQTKVKSLSKHYKLKND